MRDMNDPNLHLKLQEFPDAERGKRLELLELFDDWQEAMRHALPPEKKSLAEDFVWDGFYPYFYEQPLKILYVGRESLGLAKCDYLDEILPAYRVDKKIGVTGGAKHLNSAFYHARMLHIAHGVLHGCKKWDDIPWAERIGDTFAAAQGISFATMNLSKFSNESADEFSADWNLIRLSVDCSGDFIKREVELLDPDVVITMNIGEFLPHFGVLECRSSGGPVDTYVLRSGAKTSLLIDAWHFSAFGKSHVRDFYEPICSAIQAGIRDGLIKDFDPAH